MSGERVVKILKIDRLNVDVGEARKRAVRRIAEKFIQNGRVD